MSKTVSTLVWLVPLLALFVQLFDLSILDIQFWRIQKSRNELNQIDHTMPVAFATEKKMPSSKVKILSYDPFIAHISDFIAPSERAHLKKLG